MRSIKRLLSLAGLKEARMVPIEDDDDEDDAAWQARQDRTLKIKKLIIIAFKRIGVGIEPGDIYYDEEADREASVPLDDSDVDLRLLSEVLKTGLADSYTLSAGNYSLTVTFNVSPLLDQAL